MKVREAYLKYRTTDVEMDSRLLDTPEVVYEAYKHLGELPVEIVMALFVDARNKLICSCRLQEGTVDHCTVYPRELLLRALYAHASGFVLCHNHPSDDPTPSRQDMALTEGVQLAARALGIRFCDHLIICASGFYSFRRNGLLP